MFDLTVDCFAVYGAINALFWTWVSWRIIVRRRRKLKQRITVKVDANG